MIRFLLILNLSGMVSAQDIALPSVSDLKQDTEEGRLREKNREVIRNFLAQMYVAQNLPAHELRIRGCTGLVTEFYQVMLEEFPENALKRCPTDFQELIAVKKRKIQEFLDGAEKDIVWPYAADEEISALLFKYGLKDEKALIECWMALKLGFRNQDTPAFKVRRMHELKEEMEAGKVIVPDDVGDAEEMEELVIPEE